MPIVYKDWPIREIFHKDKYLLKREIPVPTSAAVIDTTFTGWSFNGDYERSFNPGGGVHLIQKLEDPFMYKSFSFSGNTNRYVYLKVRSCQRSSPLQIILFYGRSGGHGDDDQYTGRKNFTCDTQYHIVKFDMHGLQYGGDDWKNGTINRIRLDIPNQRTTLGYEFDLDYIYVTGENL
jgi:hypothetical protein